MHKVERRRISGSNGRVELDRCVRWCECRCYLCIYCLAGTRTSHLLASCANSHLAGYTVLQAHSIFLARSLQLCLVLQNDLTDFLHLHLILDQCIGKVRQRPTGRSNLLEGTVNIAGNDRAGLALMDFYSRRSRGHSRVEDWAG